MSVTDEKKSSAEETRAPDLQGNSSLSDGGKAEAQNDTPEPQSEQAAAPARNVHGIAVSILFCHPKIQWISLLITIAVGSGGCVSPFQYLRLLSRQHHCRRRYTGW